MRIRYSLIIGGLISILALSFICLMVNDVRANPDDPTRFVMSMSSPGRDAVEFQGAAMGSNFRLAGRVGGIESVVLNRNGTIYVLTPAIKTYREIDNPSPPVDTGNWSEWLLEPGRINPFSFAELVGLDDDISGRTIVGDGGDVVSNFEDGVLASISFPVLSGEGNITYTYSGFETDEDLPSDLFTVPSDYLLSE